MSKKWKEYHSEKQSNNTVDNLEFGSRILGTEPKGCVRCRKGTKMVLLITGLCSHDCYYCPLSEKKMGKDVVFANELRLKKSQGKETENGLIREARSINAEGTGITGGDPFLVFGRTINFIRLLKKEFGEDHHIHLYTATLPSKEQLKNIRSAGLDEIRFHLVGLLEDDTFLEEKDTDTKGYSEWDNEIGNYLKAITMASDLGLKTGVEIPAIPNTTRTLKRIVKKLEKSGAEFLNLNELEFASTNYDALVKKGFAVRDELSSAVKGSLETAYEIIEWAKLRKTELTIHFCSSKYKDAGQLRRRLKRRAENVAKPYELITEESTLFKGIIELHGSRKENLEFTRILEEKYEIPGKLISFNSVRMRIEIAPWILREIAGQINILCFLIEEYPTADRLELEREQLKQR